MGIVIVKDFPTKEEARLGHSFAGAVGKMLNNILKTVGLEESEVHCFNLIRRHVSPVDQEKMLVNQKGKIQVSAEADSAKERLFSEIQDLPHVNVVIPLGELSLFFLTGKQGLYKQRGSIFRNKTLGVNVVPTFSPADIITQGHLESVIIHDFRKAISQNTPTPFVPPVREYLIEPGEIEVFNFIKEASTADTIALDIEVNNQEVSCISIAISPEKVMSIPFIHESRDYFNSMVEARIWDELRLLFENPSIVKVIQNAAFDAWFLFVKYGIEINPIEDTMVAQSIYCPDLPKGLDFLCSWYTDEPYYKDDGKIGFQKGCRDREAFRQFWLYNAKDSALTLECWPKILSNLKKIDNYDTYRRQMKIIEPILFMETVGIRMDQNAANVAAGEMDKEVAKLVETLHQQVGYELNPNSTKQLKEHFYTLKGETPYKNRKTNKPSVDNDALKRLARKGHKEASTLQEIRKLSKMGSTYMKVKIDEDKRIRCSYNPVGTTTGRLSSSKNIFGTGTNFQNLPPVFKKFLLADEGYLAFEMDLSQAENRIVAYISNEERMQFAFEQNVDIHSQTFGMMFDIPTERVSKEDGSADFGNGQHSQRYWGKQCNHSLNYGLGFKTFAFRYELPETQARDLVERYHQIYPNVRRTFHEMVQTQLRETGFVTNCFGRKRMFINRLSRDYSDAFAFIPQSTVADIINQTMAFIYNSEKTKDVVLLNQVHDSIVFELPLSLGREQITSVISSIKNFMEQPIQNPYGPMFSIPIDTKVGLNLGEMVDFENLAEFLDE